MSDLYDVCVDELTTTPDLSALSDALFKPTVNDLGTAAKIKKGKKSTSELLADLGDLVNAGTAAQAKKALPADGKLKLPRLKWLKKLLLHQAFPQDLPPPPFTYVRLKVSVIHRDVQMPKAKPSGNLWPFGLRILADCDPEGPAAQIGEKLWKHGQHAGLAAGRCALIGLRDRKKTTGALELVIATEFADVLPAVGETFQTVAYWT